MGRTRSAARSLACIVACLVAAFALLTMPVTALADYTIKPVSIDATVGTDGSLTVVEERSFNFDDHYNGVYWEIPCGTYEGRDIEIEILSAERLRGGSWESMSLVDYASKGDNAVYTVDESYRVTTLKLFSPSDNETALFRISYRITGGVSAWADTGELYWKFVSDGWDEPSRDVTCTVHLPVPAGETVRPEENVRAWGHGPLNGNVELSSDGAVFSVPKVGTSEFAEARIAFPVEWLTQVEPESRTRLETILAEEQAWADEANARRNRARAIMTGSSIFGVVSAAVATLIGAFSWSRYKAAQKVLFDDKYFRDVPSEDHPAVLGALYNGGEPQAKEFTATLMRLSDLGAIGLDLVSTVKDGIFGSKQVDDYRLSRNNAVADNLAPADDIDRAADRFLFDFLALRSAQERGEKYETGFPPLMFSDIEVVAKEYPSSYQSKYESWESAVELACRSRGYFTSESRVPRGLPIAAGVLALIVAAGEGLAALIIEAAIPFVPIAVALVAIGIALFVIAGMMEPRSNEANEIIAKMGALRRWLLDFTRLNEAIPTDVILWNRLLVMAVVLGVSDKVIKQLQVAMPQLLEDPMLAPSYHWVVGHGSVDSPQRGFSSAVDTAASISTAELAESSDSSGGGGGGGFSGGGGGGFGGGGGGGAF